MRPLTQARLLATLATASILQGIADFGGALLLGAPLFGFTTTIADHFGPLGLYLAIFGHNLGLACLMPGIGYLAARAERTKNGRRFLGRLLLSALGLAMAAGLIYILRGPGHFTLGIALPILAGEAVAILYVGWLAHAQFARFDEHPPNETTLREALAHTRTPLLYAATALALLAAAEVYILWT